MVPGAAEQAISNWVLLWGTNLVPVTVTITDVSFFGARTTRTLGRIRLFNFVEIGIFPVFFFSLLFLLEFLFLLLFVDNLQLLVRIRKLAIVLTRPLGHFLQVIVSSKCSE